MPSPSRSNLTSPMAAQSSLSHCTTVRSGMRPHSTGQTSTTGRSQITMPPVWIPICRGAFCSSAARSTTRCGTSDCIDVGDLGRMVAVVVVINVLNSLFTPVGLDIDVDVRWPIPVRGEEPFEKQFVAHRVDGSDLQCVADR